MLSDPAINELLQNLAKLYVQRLPTEAAQLEALTRELSDTGMTPDLLDSFRHQLHGIAGSAGTFGFHEITENTRIIESLIRDISKTDILEDSLRELVIKLDGLVDQLKQACITDHPPPSKVMMESPRHHPHHPQPMLWVIEDDALQAAEIMRVLEQFNYAVRWFESFSEAEMAATHESPDGLILDLMFSKEQINAADRLTRESPLIRLGVPIVFISASDSFNARLKAVRMGALAYMLKPLDFPRLVDRLEAVLEQDRQVAYRVLIVEDDELQAQHYAAILTAAGMIVQTLAEPTEMMDRLSDFRPELVLMDIHMPGCSGAELAGMIRTYEEWVSLPVIYLSAETDLDQQLMAMGRGGDDFITKTITDTRLVASVRVRAARFRKLDSLMSRDGLTGLLKHSRIKEALDVEIARSERNALPLSVVMIDLDHFKQVNDTYGHAAGDQVIRAMAHLLRQRLRKSDLIGRYGGEEFVVILPDTTSEIAETLMKDTLARFRALDFKNELENFQVTFSAGIASTSDKVSPAALLALSDKALYQAKADGRNQVQRHIPRSRVDV